MHAIQWFEIPVIDLDRATRFYEGVLGARLRREVFGGSPLALFPSEGKLSVGGCLVKMDGRRPSADGPVVYLVVTDLGKSLGRLEGVGGELVQASTDIGEHGLIAQVRDTEGNVVGLHQPR
ncbi:MAG TPA: VOC family protein [Polyangiales bacterium]